MKGFAGYVARSRRWIVATTAMSATPTMGPATSTSIRRRYITIRAILANITSPRTHAHTAGHGGFRLLAQRLVTNNNKEDEMGVDWYSCEICGDTFPDCGPHEYCGKCESAIGPCCMDEQFKKYGTSEDQDAIDGYGETCLAECDECTASKVHDKDIMEWALDQLNVSEEYAKKQIMAARNNKESK